MIRKSSRWGARRWPTHEIGCLFRLWFIVTWVESQNSFNFVVWCVVYDATNGSNGGHEPTKVQERLGPRAVAFRSPQGTPLQVPRHWRLWCRWVAAIIDKRLLAFKFAIYICISLARMKCGKKIFLPSNKKEKSIIYKNIFDDLPIIIDLSIIRKLIFKCIYLVICKL